jgi:hypothetical protein
MKQKTENYRETQGPMPEGYDGVKTMKRQGSPALQGVGGVYNPIIEAAAVINTNIAAPATTKFLTSRCITASLLLFGLFLINSPADFSY